MMARETRKTSRAAKGEGYYIELDGIEEGNFVDVHQDDVFKVERVIECRKKGKKIEYFVLWEGYSREESSWVSESDMNEAAIRSIENPSPPKRIVLDAVSSLVSAFQESLRAGLVKGCKFTLDFRCDVFMYLFNGKGRKFKKGYMYDRSHFNSDYFRDDCFVYYNKFGECCSVEFPIHMFSYFKFLPVKYTKINDSIIPCTNRDFREVVHVFLVKKFC